MFQPQDTLDHPCDVTLVVQDGKKFKAHKDALSKASPFFEKMLNSDMKESKERVGRLEMFSESVMAATLEFIYTGNVQILTEDRARNLIVMADYLFLPRLKSLAEKYLMQKWNYSNCISTYHFAELFQCKKLVSRTRKFILANFAELAKTKEFLNMSEKEVEMWISSDKANVSAEEDVFNIILAWINHDRSERRKHFAELFRHVRLPYVSRDFLSSNVITNNLVKENDGCFDLVSRKLIDSRNYHKVFVRPRKSLESTVIVLSVGDDILGYFPREDTWCTLGDFEGLRCSVLSSSLVPCHGKLYCTRPPLQGLVCYDPFSNTWKSLPCTEGRNLQQLFVSNEDEMYALMSKPLDRIDKDPIDFPLYITKYKPESNSWEDISLLNFEMVGLSSRQGMCILAKESFIYFIGGRDIQNTVLKDVYRHNLTNETGDKLADLRIERESASGALAHGKMFVIGGFDGNRRWSNICEVYDGKTDEWHSIVCLYMDLHPQVLSADEELYLLANDWGGPKIECYDPARNEWYKLTAIPIRVNTAEALRCIDRDGLVRVNACSMRVFK